MPLDAESLWWCLMRGNVWLHHWSFSWGADLSKNQGCNPFFHCGSLSIVVSPWWDSPAIPITRGHLWTFPLKWSDSFCLLKKGTGRKFYIQVGTNLHTPGNGPRFNNARFGSLSLTKISAAHVISGTRYPTPEQATGCWGASQFGSLGGADIQSRTSPPRRLKKIMPILRSRLIFISPQNNAI